MHYAEAGTVSHGTLRGEDLISAFESTLRVLIEVNRAMGFKVDSDRDDLLQSANAWLVRNTTQGGTEPDPDVGDEEFAGYILEDLADALDEFAPPGHHFGAHEGDGSDFGFWPSEDFGHDEPEGEGTNVKLLAARIYVKLCDDDNFRSNVYATSEPYRAAIHESGLTGNIVDGSPEWEQLVEVLEFLNT